MLGAYVNAFRTPDLRKKLLFVLFMIVLFRIGSQIPAPGVNVENVHTCIQGATGGSFPDAPNDGQQWARQSLAWTVVALPGVIDGGTF